MTSPLLCLLGPTAVGKTDLTYALAERYPLHLISVDSAQIYRGLDIGSAKPDAAALARFPHALIDILNPEDSYSAAQFCRDAEAEIQKAHACGKIPLLTGGTMLYYLAYFEGLNDLPASRPETRAAIEARIAAEGTAALHAELAARDPAAAAKISPNDRQRLTRFTELLHSTGKTPSELFAAQRTAVPAYPILALALNTDRTVLHQRIATRFHAMIAQGLIDETAALRSRPHLSAESPAMRSVGYRQIWAYLDGRCSREAAIDAGIIASRQLAKRQITWMNNRLRQALPLHVFDPLAPNAQAAILERVDAFLNTER